MLLAMIKFCILLRSSRVFLVQKSLKQMLLNSMFYEIVGFRFGRVEFFIKIERKTLPNQLFRILPYTDICRCEASR